jgi:hypothetical protein
MMAAGAALGTVGAMPSEIPAAEMGEPAVRRIEVVVSVQTVVKALAIFFGVLLVYLAQEALLSIALSIVFVCGLDPPCARSSAAAGGARVRRCW